MIKIVSSLTAALVLLIIPCYTLLSFSALSLNPVQWSHTERFLLGCVLLLSLSVSFSKIIRKKFAAL